MAFDIFADSTGTVEDAAMERDALSHQPRHDPEDVMLWSDGTWCYRHEGLEYLSWMSDDYETIRFGTPRHAEITG